MPSQTERYYSFDWSNVHFVSLHTDDPPAEMAKWVSDDLAKSSLPWKIVFLHKPPHTRGTHDSDSEGDLDDLRDNLMPLLEQGGVDLVLAGHSNNYERSVLSDGFYGTSMEWSAGYAKDPGDGRESGDGAYRKPGQPGPNQGTVYIVWRQFRWSR